MTSLDDMSHKFYGDPDIHELCERLNLAWEELDYGKSYDNKVLMHYTDLLAQNEPEDNKGFAGRARVMEEILYWAENEGTLCRPDWFDAAKVPQTPDDHWKMAAVCWAYELYHNDLIYQSPPRIG